MKQGFTIRLRPTGPWRIGGTARHQVETLYHSDALYSAVTGAMHLLGLRTEWLACGAAVRFSSCFPYLGNTGLVTPPQSLWPPAPSAKVRWKAARFVPLAAVRDLIAGKALNDDAYTLDGPSQCLVPSGRPGPFRQITRKSAAVDRLTGAAEPHSTAGIEFSPNAGLWCRVSFETDEVAQQWTSPIQAAFRLLADSGFGGRRSHGWGRAESPHFSKPSHLHESDVPAEGEYWLLSAFIPGTEDQIDWTRGAYSSSTRTGRVENSGVEKKHVRVIEEGSVLAASRPPEGCAPNVAPEGFPHPVLRFGFAFAIPLHHPEVFA